jgi:hypothetical protein
MSRQLEIAAVASPRAEFSCQKTNQRKLCPLCRAEGMKKLLLGVLESGTNGIKCGNRQAHTSRSSRELAARYR